MTTPNPPGPLARTNYLSSPPGPYQPAADPNNPAYDPADVLPAAGFENSALDAEQYYRPLERLHGAGLHGTGVAYGLQVSATIGQPNVLVMPGLALDAQGRHIYLGPGGSAEVGPSADVPNTPPDLTPVSVSGAVVPTTALPAGTYYVIAQWRETFNAQGSGSNPNTDFYADTPWLRLVTVSGYLPDRHVVLGQVVLAVSGGVTVVESAGYGAAGGPQRASVSLPAQALNLRRAVTTAAPGADTVPWGAVRARESGGVEIAVAKGSDQVALVNDGGGNFSTLAVGANQATFGDAANPSIKLDSAAGTISVGSATANGLRLEGANSAAVVQRIKAFANDTIEVDSGRLWVHAADFVLDGRSGNSNRALVDEGDQLVVNFHSDYGKGVQVASDLQVLGTLTDGNGVPLMASPTSKVWIITLGAGSGDYGDLGSVATYDFWIDQNHPDARMLFTAFSSLYYIQSNADEIYGQLTYDPTVAAEIYEVDGVATGVDSSGGPLGDTCGPGWFGGKGNKISLRVRAADNSIDANAAFIIFWE